MQNLPEIISIKLCLSIFWVSFLKNAINPTFYIEGCAKKTEHTFYFIASFFYINYAFTCMCTQRQNFGNSKMVNWVNIVQKLTKIQGII